MEIKKGKTHSGEQTIKFVDQTDSNISLRIEEHSKQGKGTKVLYLDTDDDYFRFTQEDIKTLLPYLQSFAETGELEPQQSTLQGGMISVDFVKSVIEKYMNDHDAFDACEAILQDLALPETKHTQFPLQGGDERVEAIANASAKHVLDILEAQNNGLATMQEAGVAMAQNIVEQGKRIRAFEQLVREWKSLAESQKFLPSVLDDLQERTSQLLGE